MQDQKSGFELLDLVIKVKIIQMNQSNDPPLSKNLAALKCSKFYHYRKVSQEADCKRKLLDNLDSFAKEAVPVPHKTKNVGKIRRNSIASTNDPPQKGKINNENATPGTAECAIDKWINDDLISKIRCSQILSHPEKSLNSVLKETNPTNVPEKAGVKRNTRSVSSHYEANYATMVKEYEKKKEQINHEIESLRKTQSIKVQKFYETVALNANHSIETPKFGSHFSQSQKIINTKPALKAGKDPKRMHFLNAIKSQIDLQTKLRNLKHQISKQQQQKLRRILKSQYGIEEDITSIDSEEFDPFAQRKDWKVEVLASELASAHLSAEQNWNKNMKNSFDAATLNELFSALESSSERGTISLKGFVRQIGILLQNQKYLRNRDLYRIHKRIQPFHRETFVKVLEGKE